MRRDIAILLLVSFVMPGCVNQADPPAIPASTGPAAASSAGSGVASPRQLVPGCRRVVVAAGDIVNDVAVADRTGQLAAAQNPDYVLTLGDNQYERGTLEEYERGYDQLSWGSLKSITRPVPGNHEYETPGAAGYFDYFRDVARYYAYDAGCGWRAYALNSEIINQEQISWLRRDLSAHPDRSVLAYWHIPRFSSGTTHGGEEDMQPFWDALRGRTGVVLNGHEHNYERFAPIGGLREFVVGTGGSSTYEFGSPVQGSERRIEQTPGVLRLEIYDEARYRWTFLDVRSAARDQGRS